MFQKIYFLKFGIPITIHNCLNPLLRLTHRTILRLVRLIIWQILWCENSLYFNTVNRIYRTEYRTDAAYCASIVFYCFDGSRDRFTGVDGRSENQNLAVHDHTLYIVTEQNLAALVIFRRNYGNVVAVAHGMLAGVSEVLCHEGADGAGLFQTYNGVDGSGIAVFFGESSCSFTAVVVSYFDCGHINVGVDMGVAGGIMTLHKFDSGLWVFLGSQIL